MTDLNHSQGPPLGSQRVPLEREVVLEFEHFSSFISEYSANISLGGMFIKTDEPRLPKTVFRFEVRLADDAPLISGLAKVLWARDSAEAADRPAGMGVRFVELEEAGRTLIERIVREHAARGGKPFSLEEGAGSETPGAGAPAVEAKPALPEAGPAPSDRAAAIELPPLEDLLEEARTPTSGPPLDTPPRGWRPGIKVARPRTRPQFIGAIAVTAGVIGVLVFFLVRMFASSPVLDEAETEPVALPRAEASEEVEAETEAPLPPFTALEEITWRRAGNGAEIVVRLNGSLPDGSWSVERIGDPSRQLLKLLGASRPYPTETIDVGVGGVRQLRTGFHDGGAGNEQHLVIDLVDPRVVLEESVVEGSVVRLRFRRLS